VSEPEDVLNEDPELDEFAAEVERHRDALFDYLLDYMDDEAITEAYLAPLLLDLMVRMRMTAYGFGVESPSVAGLKLDLDRLQKEVGEFLREAKRGVEEYIVHIKDMRAEAAAAVDGDDDGDDESEEDEADEEDEEDDEEDQESPK
jgi:hypothetical protein